MPASWGHRSRARAASRWQSEVLVDSGGLAMSPSCPSGRPCPGVLNFRANSTVGDLRENVTLTTSEYGYAWVNPAQIWALGTVGIATCEVHIAGYAVECLSGAGVPQRPGGELGPVG